MRGAPASRSMPIRRSHASNPHATPYRRLPPPRRTGNRMRNDFIKTFAKAIATMSYIIPSWDMPSVPVAGRSERFPVRHIYCVGRNYAEHAKEMGGDASKEPPFFFTKAADSIVPVVPPAVGSIAYPLATKNFHHEIELVVAIGGRGTKVAPERALDVVFGYAVGLDMTRRDLQSEMREKKRPWDIGKSFAGAAPIAPIYPVASVGHLARGTIRV